MPSFLQGLEDFARGVLDAPWADALYALRTLFGFLDVAMLAAFGWLFPQALEFRPRFRWSEIVFRAPRLDQARFKERWERIIGRTRDNSTQGWVLAIIEADKLTDDALKELGFGGEHMADRLEKLPPDRFPSLDRLWRAHRIRNELVHTPDFLIQASDARELLSIYERFLKELGALPS